jgi:hypothetical protein
LIFKKKSTLFVVAGNKQANFNNFSGVLTCFPECKNTLLSFCFHGAAKITFYSLFFLFLYPFNYIVVCFFFIFAALKQIIMPAIILQNPNAVQFNYILEYAQKENVKYEISEISELEPKKYPLLPPVTLTDAEMRRIEKSINSGVSSDISALKEYLTAQL